MPKSPFNSLQQFNPGAGLSGQFYSLPQLEKENVGPISKLPVSIRIVLESVLRNVDGQRITEDDVRSLANWQPTAERTEEIPFVVARVLLQDFTGAILAALFAVEAASFTVATVLLASVIVAGVDQQRTARGRNALRGPGRVAGVA